MEDQYVLLYDSFVHLQPRKILTGQYGNLWRLIVAGLGIYEGKQRARLGSKFRYSIKVTLR